MIHPVAMAGRIVKFFSFFPYNRDAFIHRLNIMNNTSREKRYYRVAVLSGHTLPISRRRIRQ